MLEIRELTKRYGATTAVDRLSFTVQPGTITGFLGPNGAGKTTTMRALLGLTTPTSGQALVNGRRYRELAQPLREVGALLDAGAAHPGRRALHHLRAVAASNGIGARKVVTVLEEVGLSGVARKRVGEFSLGMKQRLGMAAALLGDPQILVLDEPVNGLDPDGIRWIRELLRAMADDGRTILLSSHLMSEMEMVADRLIVVGSGKLIADTSVSELARQYGRGVLVRSTRLEELAETLRTNGGEVSPVSGGIIVSGMDSMGIGDLAAAAGIPLHEVTDQGASLEDAYLSLTADSVQYRAERNTHAGRDPQ